MQQYCTLFGSDPPCASILLDVIVYLDVLEWSRNIREVKPALLACLVEHSFEQSNLSVHCGNFTLCQSLIDVSVSCVD
jgi:hypothetical protein